MQKILFSLYVCRACVGLCMLKCQSSPLFQNPAWLRHCLSVYLSTCPSVFLCPLSPRCLCLYVCVIWLSVSFILFLAEDHHVGEIILEFRWNRCFRRKCLPFAGVLVEKRDGISLQEAVSSVWNEIQKTSSTDQVEILLETTDRYQDMTMDSIIEGFNIYYAKLSI